MKVLISVSAATSPLGLAVKKLRSWLKQKNSHIAIKRSGWRYTLESEKNITDPQMNAIEKAVPELIIKSEIVGGKGRKVFIIQLASTPQSKALPKRKVTDKKLDTSKFIDIFKSAFKGKSVAANLKGTLVDTVFKDHYVEYNPVTGVLEVLDSEEVVVLKYKAKTAQKLAEHLAEVKQQLSKKKVAAKKKS